MSRTNKSIYSRILALLTALVMVLPLACFGGSAIEPSYKVSEEYRYSPYYQRLAAYELTGDQRYDAVAIALTQLGYHEGNSDRDMDGLNTGGSKNFVEYTRLYGKVDNGEGNGVSYGYAWCAAFVSWCLRQARVPTSVAVTEISCNRMTKWYKSNSTFVESGDHLPMAGDIIMFVNEAGKTTPSHVGFVTSCEDGYVYTVEGNSGGEVAIHKYALTHNKILGYCIPDYDQRSGTDYSFSSEDYLSKPGKYVTTASSLNVRKGPGTSYDVIGSLPKGSEVDVIEIRNGWGQIDYKGQVGWISMSYASRDSETVYTVTYNANGGSGGISRQRKLSGDTIVIADKIPVKSGFTFLGWSEDKNASAPDYKIGDEYTADKSVTLYAVWKAPTHKVRFYNDNGALISSRTYEHGDALILPDDPEKESDTEYTYAFAGWDKPLAMKVTADATYTAVYTATPIPIVTTPVVTDEVTAEPTDAVTDEVTEEPTDAVTDAATEEPTDIVTDAVTEEPTDIVTDAATEEPTDIVTGAPAEEPTEGDEVDSEPSLSPDTEPAAAPTPETETDDKTSGGCRASASGIALMTLSLITAAFVLSKKKRHN